MQERSDVRQTRPFGYWVKHIDQRIEEMGRRVLAEEGLNRRLWQVLNTIASGPLGPADLDRTLAPFVSDEEPTMRPYVDELAGRGWVTRTDDGDLALTDAGRDAHARAGERMYAARARVVEGLSSDDYDTLMNLLERIAGNLDAVVAA
ncbi:MarR family winged helix-turn-helix transcriptional regulator [Actinoallomurus vinaceus]|uniref:MarR family winged helix-turn-helix transcriptional regulator n=1 Tax=Actinoallomurus vinaceus TaxID=1080074 RepID=A0ABP8US01_9ACTN